MMEARGRQNVKKRWVPRWGVQFQFRCSLSSHTGRAVMPTYSDDYLTGSQVPRHQVGLVLQVTERYSIPRYLAFP